MMRLFVIACVVAGCSRGSQDDLIAEGKAQVRTLFSAAAADDCTTLRALVEKLDTEADCQKLLETWHHDAIELVDIIGAERDGRDKRAVIVRVRMKSKGKERELLFRAVREANRWKIVF